MTGRWDRAHLERVVDREPVTPRRPRWPLILAIVIGAVVAIGFVAQWRSDVRPIPTPATGRATGTAVGADTGVRAGAGHLVVGRDGPHRAGAEGDVAGPVAVSRGDALGEVAPHVLAVPPVGPVPDTSTVLRGTATWCAPTPTHCQSWGGKAKLGAVQSFTWGDKPYSVRVCRVGGACTTVRVVSFCACGNTLIDLSPFSFRKLAPLSRGRIHVTVERISTPGLPVLPPTSTEGSR